MVEATHERTAGREGFLAMAALAVPPLLFVFFSVGHGQIDRPDPQTGAAFGMYLVAALGGLAAAVAFHLVRPHWSGWRLLVSLPPAMLLGWWLGASAEVYGWGALLFYFVWWYAPGFWFFVTWISAILTAAIVGAASEARHGMEAALTGGQAIALAIAGAATYHLVTLDRQAEMARAAHETPLGLLVPVTALLIVLALRRRR